MPKKTHYFTPIVSGTLHTALALIVLAGLTLMGCAPEPVVDENGDVAVAAEIEPEPVRASENVSATFAVTPTDIDAWLSQTDLFAANRSLDMVNDDSFSGGQSFWVAHTGGSLAYYSAANGRVWRIRQNSGKVDQCGTPEKGVAAATEMASRFALVDLTEQQKSSVRDALANDRFVDFNLGIAKLGIVGSCIDTISFTAL